MSDDAHSTNGSGTLTWLDRLSQVLQGDPQDREELLTLLRDAQQRGLFGADALTMIEGVLQVSEMQVRDIMVPRSRMVVLERDAKPDEMLPAIIGSGHSRFPVVGDSRDEVVGILLAKDLLRAYTEDSTERFRVKEYLRPPVFVPESKRLNVLLKEFRASRNHMAIVVNEYGGVAGMITIEDVIEQIVGEIEDEHDIDEGSHILEHDGQFTVKAITPVEDINEALKTSFDAEETDTIGGVVMNAFGHMPKRDESIVIDGLLFTVLRSDNRRIYLLRIRREQEIEGSL